MQPSSATAQSDPQPSNNPSVQHSPAIPRLQVRRKGKIARLPDRVRQLVNFMLRDGRPYHEIVKKLDELGYTISDDSLSRWHAAGYQDWLHEESLLDNLHTRIDFAGDVVNPKGASLIQEAGLRIAIIRLYSLLLQFDPAILQQRIAENPGVYARILNALCKLTSGAVACERLRLDQAEAQTSTALPRL
jgi:hypothetical protein